MKFEIKYASCTENPRLYITPIDEGNISIGDIVCGVFNELMIITVLAFLFALSFTSFVAVISK